MTDNRPTHHLNVVTESTSRDGKTKARYHEIAPLWTTEKGNLSGEIPAGVTITGRLLITTAKKTAEPDTEIDGHGPEAVLSDT